MCYEREVKGLEGLRNFIKFSSREEGKVRKRDNIKFWIAAELIN